MPGGPEVRLNDSGFGSSDIAELRRFDYMSLKLLEGATAFDCSVLFDVSNTALGPGQDLEVHCMRWRCTMIHARRTSPHEVLVLTD